MNQTKQTNRFALFFFVFFILIGQLLYLIPPIRNLPYAWFTCIVQLAYFLIPTILYFLWTKKDPKEVFRLQALGWKNLIIIVLLGFALQPLMQFLSFFMTLFFPNVAQQSFDALEGAGFLTTLLTMAILPAILEEFALRGVFLSGYKNLGATKSILWTALLFGLLHMNPQQFPYAFMAGLFFCFVVERTGSIWASVIPHFIINATSVVVMFLPGVTEAAPAAPPGNTFLLVYTALSALLSLPFLGALGYFFIKINPRPKTLTGTIPREKERIFTPPVFFIFSLFFLFGLFPYFSYLM